MKTDSRLPHFFRHGPVGQSERGRGPGSLPDGDEPWRQEVCLQNLGWKILDSDSKWRIAVHCLHQVTTHTHIYTASYWISHKLQFIHPPVCSLSLLMCVTGLPTLCLNWSGVMVACVCVQLMANMWSLRRTGSSLQLLTMQVSVVSEPRLGKYLNTKMLLIILNSSVRNRSELCQKTRFPKSIVRFR